MVAGATPSTEDDSFWLEGDDPSGTPFVAIADMSRRECVSVTAKSLSLDGLKSRSMPVGQPGTLLFAMYASVGEVAFLGISATWNQALLGITPDPDKVDSRFLRYVLLDMRGDLLRNVRSNTQANLNARQVGDIWFQRPPLHEQFAIADFLDRETTRIDTLIEEQQRLIEVLRERRDAVLSAAFDTGPSTEATKVGRLLAARPSYGVLVPRYVDEAEGVPFVRVGDLLNLSPERPLLAIPPEQSDEYSRTKIVGGEVLLGVVGKMGQAVLAPQWLAGANVARAVAVLRCKDPAVAPLLCAWFGSNNFRCKAELATSGDSIQPTLGMKDLARFDINLPSDPNAAAGLAGRLAKIDTLIEETERFIEFARERRVALITAAVTGQIDVREMA
ncbi:restriction endonuclease subunit S [Micromonospora noduli]|nr:restriction endonuclease subunit S [Micromonospora noduli]